MIRSDALQLEFVSGRACVHAGSHALLPLIVQRQRGRKSSPNSVNRRLSRSLACIASAAGAAVHTVDSPAHKRVNSSTLSDDEVHYQRFARMTLSARLLLRPGMKVCAAVPCIDCSLLVHQDIRRFGKTASLEDIMRKAQQLRDAGHSCLTFSPKVRHGMSSLSIWFPYTDPSSIPADK